ncbi:hypothetical protein SprV_0100253200 [Sparganum proliferum]
MDNERLPNRLFYGDVATGSRLQWDQISLYKGTLKTPLNRPQINPANCVDLVRDRPTDLEEDSEDKRSDLRGKPHRCCESQTRSTQISTALTSQRQRPIAPNVFTVSADILSANWTCMTPSDHLQHSDCTNRRLSVHLSLTLYAVN